MTKMRRMTYNLGIYIAWIPRNRSKISSFPFGINTMSNFRAVRWSCDTASLGRWPTCQQSHSDAEGGWQVHPGEIGKFIR